MTCLLVGNAALAIPQTAFAADEKVVVETNPGMSWEDETVNIENSESGWDDDDSYDTSWYTEAGGKSATEYTITDAKDLAGLAYILSSEDFGGTYKKPETFEGKTIKLAEDIRLQDEGVTILDSSYEVYENLTLKKWKPIGSRYHFAGTFDGQNHTIYGLYIDELLGQDNKGKNASYGLFDQTSRSLDGKGATISNLKLADTYIHIKLAGETVSSLRVGAILGNGSNSATLKNCSVEGRVVMDAGEANLITSSNYRAGGVVGEISHPAGYTEDTVSSCEFSGVMLGSFPSMGGIAGSVANGAVRNCANRGLIANQV